MGVCNKPNNARKHNPEKILTSSVRLLDLVKLVVPLVPEIEIADDKIGLDEKVVFTIGSAILFGLFQLPTYGLTNDAALKLPDPFSTLRPIFALEQATLLELGILPIITAGFVWQLAAGLKYLKVNFLYSYDRELFQTAQKITSFLLAASFALALIVSGYFDPVIRGYNPITDSLPLGTYVLIFVQIFGSSVLLTLITEVIDKGYGFGSGVLCFLALHAATGLVKDLVGFELISLGPDQEPQTYGVVASLVKSLFSMNLTTIKNSVVGLFSRPGLPTLWSVAVVVATGLVVIALQNFRLELPIRSSKARGQANVFPIRLLYTGALPVLFAYTVLANIQVVAFFVSLGISHHYPLVSSVLASYDGNGKLAGGLAFYFSSPHSFVESLLSPVRAVVYTITIVALSIYFATVWVGISGSSPKDVTQQFKAQSIVIAGKREISITSELKKIIPKAAVAGALALAVVAVVGELLGISGKTAAVAIGLSGAFAVLEDFMIDFQQGGGSGSQLINSLASFQ